MKFLKLCKTRRKLDFSRIFPIIAIIQQTLDAIKQRPHFPNAFANISRR
jgi:hypothetical protein